MKKLSIGVLFISGFLFAGSSFANVTDLSCDFKNGGDMLVTHDDESIYIAYSDPKFSPDDNVIILGKSSKNVEQVVIPATQYAEFSLSGITDQNIMVYISYIPKNLDGIPVADFSLVNDKGNITQTGKCIAGTIKIRNNLLEEGISGVRVRK
ncbi:hypothetical protein PJ163_001685 [Salmonella enterica]|nr:hypothetical protein [Salmonella enterica subsp. enterica serovar Typhimurium]EEJ3913773.1 hypothetical protein [Salmonella enterica subsp. enterica serovar Waral]EIX6638279.1 hypothetical protein [Salmonella enterica]EKJ9440379.1 hypothetical protein [Salmonella enterica]EKJ9687740.1 hypothetical protein [Salmonella enterica]